jgi:integrase
MSIVTHVAGLAGQIRIFDPDCLSPCSGSLSACSTLTELYERFVLPMRRMPKRAAEGTIEQDRVALDLWVQYTGNPRISDIDSELCQAFIERISRRPGLRGRKTISANTIRKIAMHLQFILDCAGPEVRRDRPTAGLLDSRPPYIMRPDKVDKPATDDFTLGEIGLWLEACKHARQTANLMGIPAAKWWRALILFAYNTGLRIQSIMGAEWDMLDVYRPDWIVIPPEIYKGGKVGGRFFVNRQAREAAESIRRPGQSRLFPWQGWPKSASWLHVCRREILAHSQIPEHRRFGFHGLRKALITWIAPKNAMIASMVAGHRRGNVTRDCYVNPGVVQELLSRVPQPRRERQRDLF